ncbi:MAG: T9SS type A sorting domain-containing protein [Bacteroidales bacterium]|nr:T9SS type A sorting domain-containing protein [Bacteroidales bacterium]
MANNSYLRLDSVVVENLSRSWSETLVYPDTAITFSNLSIADVRGGNISIESYPNPFRCTAQVHISHAEAGDYSLRLYSLSGQVLSEKTVRLDGDNIFEVSLKKARTAVLTIRSEQVSKSVKLIGRGGASADAIKFISTIRGGEKRQSARPFVSGDTMRYIGYATVDGCAVGSKKTVKAQNSDETFRMVFMEGAVLGAFSVSPTQKVFFSKGNLQWSATGGRSTPTTHLVVGDTTAAGTWRFAEQQTYFVGNNNRYISSTYTGWIDLFGWGTSGYNNAHPYISSFTRSDYPQGAAYIARTNYDWGVYNAISNGENTPGRWRTLTLSEASYIFQGRTDAALKRGEAIIDGIKGLVLLPDSWTLSTDQPFIADTG